MHVHILAVGKGLGWVPLQAAETWNNVYPTQLSLVLLKLGSGAEYV